MRRFIVAFFVTLLIPFNILKAESTVAYANFGLDIGATGIVTFGTDIFLSGAPNPVGIRFFHGIRWDSSAKYFRDFYVSPAFSTGILQMTRGNVMGDSADELIVFDKAGIAHFYDPTTVTEIGSLFTTTTPEAFTVADLNGDGVVELLTTGSNKVVVHDAQGNQLWLTTGDGGFSVFVAQLDADPAFEIVTASGAVFDWTTKAKQWTLPSSQVGRTLAADVDNDGVNELIVTLGSTAIRCYDIDTQSQKWSVSGFGTALALENISGTSTPELLVGIGSGVGSLRVLNPLTGAQITSVTIGDAGVTDIEVLNIDGGSDLEIIFGAGQSSTGPDHFHMYNAATLQSKYKSTAFSSALFDLQTGDVDSDGHLEMVAVARTAEQEGGGRVVIFDSATFTIENISSQLPPITNVPDLWDSINVAA
jgi:hypothetical protein